MECHEIVNIITNILSAIGTVGASIIALCLALSGNKPRIDCAFMWESATRNKPTLIISNIGNRTVIIDNITLSFHKQKIGNIDVLRNSAYSEGSIIPPNQLRHIVIDVDSIQSKITGKPAKDQDKIYKLTAKVETTTGKKYKSHYRYSYNDILSLFFWAGFDEE